MPTEREEDKPLRDDDVLLRRIPKANTADFMTFDEVTGRHRPSSGAFEADDDGVSVYIERVLSAYELDAVCIFEDSQDGIAELHITRVREAGDATLTVIKDPWPADVPNPQERKHAAHALIKGLGELGKGPRKRSQRDLARGAEMRDIPNPFAEA